MKRLFIFLIFALGINLCPLFAAEYPTLTGNVVDEADVLTVEQELELENLLIQTDRVIAISLKSLRDKTLEEYSLNLARHWKKDQNFVLVIIVPQSRQIRIEVGDNLEGVLTDIKTSRIIRDIMAPLAKEGNYDKSLIEGSKEVLKELENNNVSAQKGYRQYTKKFFDNIKSNNTQSKETPKNSKVDFGEIIMSILRVIFY